MRGGGTTGDDGDTQGSIDPRKRRQSDPTAGQGRGETPRSPGGPDGTVMGRLRIGAGGTGRAGTERVNGGRSPGAFKHPQEHRGDASARGQPRKSAREGSAPPPPGRSGGQSAEPRLRTPAPEGVFLPSFSFLFSNFFLSFAFLGWCFGVFFPENGRESERGQVS